MDFHPQIMSICSGLAALELGVGLAIPSTRTILYVEREAYCCEVLAQRIEEGVLDEAPIWSDIASFDGSSWRGKVDLLTCGLPSKPIKVGGEGPGTHKEVWAWTEVARIIGEVGSDLVFLEGEIAVFESGLPGILGALANFGYDTEWDLFSAAECGASQVRNRFFLLGFKGGDWRSKWAELSDLAFLLADTEADGSGEEETEIRDDELAGTGLSGDRPGGRDENLVRNIEIPIWPPGPVDLDAWEQISERNPSFEPIICRVADEYSDRMDLVDRTNRVQALEKSVVPVTAGVAFCLLIDRALEI